MTQHGLSVEERFLLYVAPEDGSDCLLWTGSKNSQGYGYFGVDKKIKKAHRVSYELYIGIIPTAAGWHGTCVLHKCDNPSCVNPDHLFLGSQADNIKDMISKGRDVCGKPNPARGVDVWCAKLTESQVVEIYKDPRTHRAIAKDYGIGKTMVGSIKTGKKWVHVTGGQM